MPYPVIKENSLRHFLNSLLSDGGSWGSDRSGSREAFMGMAKARDSHHRLATRDDALSADASRWRPVAQTISQAQDYSTFTSHAHSQGRDHWKLGSGQDEPPWPGAHKSTGCLSRVSL